VVVSWGSAVIYEEGAASTPLADKCFTLTNGGGDTGDTGDGDTGDTDDTAADTACVLRAAANPAPARVQGRVPRGPAAALFGMVEYRLRRRAVVGSSVAYGATKRLNQGVAPPFFGDDSVRELHVPVGMYSPSQVGKSAKQRRFWVFPRYLIEHLLLKVKEPGFGAKTSSESPREVHLHAP